MGIGTLLVLCAWPAANLLAQDTGQEYFEQRVRPILVARCYQCHSGTKTSGGLSLATRDGWQRGGDSGPAIVPGKPADSLLIDAVSYGSLEMPPPDAGNRLSDEEVATLRRWVEMGAPDPREESARLGGMSLEEANGWWSFQPLPPADANPSPAKIDEFIDAALAARSLTANPPADKRTLIRRATYDLTGLPPTPEEVDAFVQDDSPEAFARLVERLLASPQYGVQWGRHWLDVVRYADTAGENTDRPLPHAWRYRNWVFDAVNRDLPYDEFVRLQIAGDILRADAEKTARSEGIIATGYLAVARRFGHDIDKDVHLTYEDAIGNLGKGFLGLTLGCARCHDHKYDPITSRDYYALYGILDSTRFSFPGCEPKGQPRDLVALMSPEEIEARLAPWRAQAAAREAEVKRRETIASRQRLKELAAGACRVLAAGKVGEGASVAMAGDDGQPLDVAVQRGEVLQLSVSPNQNHGADSTLVEWTIEEVGSQSSGRPRRWSLADLVGKLAAANPASADASTWCFLDMTDGPAFLVDKKETLEGHAELAAWSHGDTPSVFANASAEPVSVWTTLPGRSFFVHPGPKGPVAVAWICPRDGLFRATGRVADVHPANLDGVSFRLEHCSRAAYGDALLEAGRVLAAPLPEVPPQPVIPVAYAVAEASPHNARMHERGDPEKLGEEVPRGWLTTFGGQTLPEGAGSGRRELADWMSRHPLAARVMVNRIWQGHFGAGLVRTPNDFGSRGERPTHPELLDWLAAQFVASGYHVKSMQRLIMNSAAYKRASTPRAEIAAVDPDNRLLARFNLRRLQAEEIRDSLLACAGHLDLQPGGAHPFPPESTWKFTQHNPFSAVYETNKRSAYLMVQRQRRHPFLALFDGADPNASTPARQTTTVPTQALYFLNAPFFHAQARRLAEVTMAGREDDRSRMDWIFQTLFQRAPTAAEIERGERFLNAYPASPQEKWAGYARVLLASNEFLHVE